MTTIHDLRSVIRVELDCDDQRIDQLLRASKRAGARTGTSPDEADALTTMWLQHRGVARSAAARPDDASHRDRGRSAICSRRRLGSSDAGLD